MIKELNIVTDNNTLNKAEEFLNDFRAEYLLELKDNFMNILIAFTEAVNNAVNHGNKKNPNKNVNILLEKKSKYFQIQIKDEGSGFIEDNLPNPTLPENLLKQSGRGVFLIRKLSDDVEIISDKRGTLVKMRFKI